MVIIKIGLIGPTKIEKYLDATGFAKEDYNHFMHELGSALSKTNHELIIVPEPTAASSKVATIYRDYHGKKVIGSLPIDDSEFGHEWLDESLVDEIISCGTWRNQPESLCEESDILLMIGLSPGTMVELCYAKWFSVKKIIIFNNWISAPIHKEVAKDLPIVYIDSIEELNEELRS